MADSASVDQEAERAVLGSIVLLGDPAYVLKLIRRGLTRECFYWTGYAALYAAAVEIAERGDPEQSIKATTVNAKLQGWLTKDAPPPGTGPPIQILNVIGAVQVLNDAVQFNFDIVGTTSPVTT